MIVLSEIMSKEHNFPMFATDVCALIEEVVVVAVAVVTTNCSTLCLMISADKQLSS